MGAQTALAVDSGPTVTGDDVCMQTTFSGHTSEPVPNSDKLNCTAEDVRLSDTESVDPATCIEGETFTLTATFALDVTSNERFDTGFYFNIGGGASARLPGTGTCSLSVLDPALDPGLNLDGGDFCGDLNAGIYTSDPDNPDYLNRAGEAVTFTIPDVVCQRAPGTNRLRLPYCTAWHSNQGTLCTQNTEADPDTKAKCVCNDNFTVPVIVETASLEVTKLATPTSVPETGQTVTYSVKVENKSQFVDVTITSIEDDLYGDLTSLPACGAGDPPPTCTPSGQTSCASLIGDVLQENGGNATCYFQAFVSGDFQQSITDVAEVCGDQQGTNAEVCDDDDAVVTIADVPANPSLAKTAQSASCAVDVAYQVVVSNPSAFDTVTINASGLDDDKFGDITTAHAANGTFKQVVSTTCGIAVSASPPGSGTLPHNILPGGNYTCTFVGRINDPNCEFTHTNTVTGDLTDDDGVDYTKTDDATVTVTAPTLQ